MNESRTRHYLEALASAWRVIWPVVRQILGWMFIILGLIGLVLPMLQGVLFLAIGIALVGRRNWLIRRSSVAFKRFLRRWAAAGHPLVGQLGRLALRAQQRSSRQIRELRWRYAERRRRRQQLCVVTANEETHAPRHERTSERV